MKKTKITNKITLVLSIAILLMSVLLWVPRLMGMSTYYVSSDSMEPQITKGSFAFVESLDFKDIRVGEDVLVFSSPYNSKTFMHRVIAVDSDEQLVYTKGDKNNTRDPLPTEFDACSGRVKFHIPLVGYAAWALDTLAGKIAVAVFYIVCLAVLIESHRVKKTKKRWMPDEK